MIPELIILDMDGTLYDLDDIVEQNYQMQVDYLSQFIHKTKEETKEILAQNNIFPIITEKSKSATEYFLCVGIDKNEWSRYREEHFDLNKIDITKSVKVDVIRTFASYTNIVLLSSNSYNGVEATLTYLGINKAIFQEIVCSNNFENGKIFNKKEALCYLFEKYKIPFSNMLSIGDRYQTDVAPLLVLGGRGVVIRKPIDLNQVLIDMKNDKLESKEEYQYYTEL